MPAITMKVLAVAGFSAIALAGCTGGSTAPATPATPAGQTTPPALVEVPASSAPARAETPAPATAGGGGQDAGLTATDWSAIDQALAEADSALAQSDADATHNEQGDTTP